jgi:hypothetical protein
VTRTGVWVWWLMSVRGLALILDRMDSKRCAMMDADESPGWYRAHCEPAWKQYVEKES